jgi:hypothetical protein
VRGAASGRGGRIAAARSCRNRINAGSVCARSNSATLDGGCVIDHQGFSDSDRTFDIRASLDRDESDILWNLFTGQTYLNVSTKEGFFYGVIENMADENGNVRLSILVKE